MDWRPASCCIDCCAQRFCQANTDATIISPAGKYAPITAADYLRQRIAANF